MAEEWKNNPCFETTWPKTTQGYGRKWVGAILIYCGGFTMIVYMLAIVTSPIWIFILLIN